MHTPHYQILHKDLKAQIISGIIKEGDLLPSENELCEKYHVTRSTVRKALDILVNEGYIIKRKGKGSIVKIKRNSLGILSFRGFSDVLGNKRRKIFSILLQDPVLIHWPKNFFYTLSEKEVHAKTFFISRLRFVEEDPVLIEYAYVPNLNLDNFISISLVNNSLFETLRSRFHIEVISVSQDLRAISASEDVASLLNYYPGAPVIQVYRKYTTSRKELNIYSSLYCKTDKYFLSSEYE